VAGLGRTLILGGLLLVAAGLLTLGLARFHIPFGRLPGDLSWRGRNWTVSFPLATCLLFSVLLSLFFWIINYLRR
jgi:hypothetical protein